MEYLTIEVFEVRFINKRTIILKQSVQTKRKKTERHIRLDLI